MLYLRRIYEYSTILFVLMVNKANTHVNDQERSSNYYGGKISLTHAYNANGLPDVPEHVSIDKQDTNMSMVRKC